MKPKMIQLINLHFGSHFLYEKSVLLMYTFKEPVTPPTQLQLQTECLTIIYYMVFSQNCTLLAEPHTIYCTCFEFMAVWGISRTEVPSIG